MEVFIALVITILITSFASYFLIAFIEGGFPRIPFTREIADWFKDVFMSVKKKIAEFKHPQLKTIHKLKEIQENYYQLVTKNISNNAEYDLYINLNNHLNKTITKCYSEFERDDIRDILAENEKIFLYILFNLQENDKVMKKKKSEAFAKMCELLELFVQEFNERTSKTDKAIIEKEMAEIMAFEKENSSLIEKKEKQIANELNMFLEVKKKGNELNPNQRGQFAEKIFRNSR